MENLAGRNDRGSGRQSQETGEFEPGDSEPAGSDGEVFEARKAERTQRLQRPSRKNHEPDFYKLENNDYQSLFDTVHKLSAKVADKFKPHKVGLIIAGWDVPHTHVHIVPMNDYNDITSKSIMEGKRANPTEKEQEYILNLLN